jgi:hypothetical protein
MRELLDKKRFGSRNVFFQRLWNRLHRDPMIRCETLVDTAPTKVQREDWEPPAELNEDHWDCLVQGSRLVNKDDIGLVPDSQLASVRHCDGCAETIQLTKFRIADGATGSLSAKGGRSNLLVQGP